jgi:hypothetical protein
MNRDDFIAINELEEPLVALLEQVTTGCASRDCEMYTEFLLYENLNGRKKTRPPWKMEDTPCTCIPESFRARLIALAETLTASHT